MGVVTPNGSDIKILLLYRQSIQQGSGAPIDVVAVIEGFASDIKCSLCGKMRTWIPGEESLMKLLQEARREN